MFYFTYVLFHGIKTGRSLTLPDLLEDKNFFFVRTTWLLSHCRVSTVLYCLPPHKTRFVPSVFCVLVVVVVETRKFSSLMLASPSIFNAFPTNAAVDKLELLLIPPAVQSIESSRILLLSSFDRKRERGIIRYCEEGGIVWHSAENCPWTLSLSIEANRFNGAPLALLWQWLWSRLESIILLFWL